ncbi:hypothetical protein [Streptomyces abikoensis]|uniref:hypothetical protein n=1 Tax=Streptomyces abikoensis TaxID=97398 RepID=UPI00167BCB87|nr:hypothetical protein [Streptomyces abikoensis]GGP35104.1 hypothetical protein GCM10010214_04580 [Streptomyces abikoensis]
MTDDEATVQPTARFSVLPGGPPGLALAPAGETGYPGVRLQQTSDSGTWSPQDVYVALPKGKGLQFVAEGGCDYLLTVLDARKNTKTYRGTLSADGQAVTFEGVGPALSGKGTTSMAWVAVKASDHARLGETRLVFCVGDRTSESTCVRVVDHIPFSVSPGGPPDVTLKPGGATGYPGVHLYADDDGTVSPQDVHVALPEGDGLRFVPEGGDGYLLSVQGSQGVKTYRGSLSSDGRALTFQGVDPALSGKGATSTAWVAVKALAHAPKVQVSLVFCMGDRTSSSTPVDVDPQT